MKTSYFLILMIFSVFNSFSQECVDVSEIEDPGPWPGGGTTIYEGDKIAVKTGNIFSHYGLDIGDRLQFRGYILFDVSASDCEDKTFEISSMNSRYVVVDNDTVDLEEPGFTYPYVSDNYTIEFNARAAGVIINGDFNYVEIGYSTQLLIDACLIENCLGVNTTEVETYNEVSVFPNPANNVLNVNTSYESLEIFNLLGEVVLSANGGNSSIDISSLQTGSYFLSIQSDGNSSVSKFIKK